jgi:hypothetical protein
MTDGLKDTNKSDEEYWEEFTPKLDEVGCNDMIHDINLEVICKFKGINGGVIYETKEKEINCNLRDLETWFSNLKKTIRMLDETISDKEVGDGL